MTISHATELNCPNAAETDGVIGIAELERATPSLQPGDIVTVDTGWPARVLARPLAS